MAKARVITERKFFLELTQEEARELQLLMQYPIAESSFPDYMRASIFQALKVPEPVPESA